MKEVLVPLMPGMVWILACGIAILLLFIIFGYHMYERNRLKAMLGDSQSIGELAARKETLAQELQELKNSVALQKGELLKLEADRRQQELFRVELGNLQTRLAEKTREHNLALETFATLEAQVAKGKQTLGRLNGEIKALEQQKLEFEPMERSLQDMRIELDKGNVRLAQLAEQELKVGALMHQARGLAREIEDLTHTLEPMRHEKNRLRMFVDQARQAAAVKNEQLMEQKQQLKTLERHKSNLAAQIGELEQNLESLQHRHKEKSEALRELEQACDQQAEKNDAARETLLAELEEMRRQKQSMWESVNEENQKRLSVLLSQIQTAQSQLEHLRMRRNECVAEIAALSGRAEVMKREMELNKTGPKVRISVPQGRQKAAIKKPASSRRKLSAVNTKKLRDKKTVRISAMANN